jgi:hypothetical protein
MTRATRSAATPMARKSHPAASLEPRDLANQPFIVMPAAARAKAAIDKTIGATWRHDGVTGSAGQNVVSVGDFVTEGSAIAGSGTKPSIEGLSASADRNSVSATVAVFAFCPLRRR